MSEITSTGTCLLCNQYFDKKPNINHLGNGNDDNGPSQFESSFNLFKEGLNALWKLSKVGNGREMDETLLKQSSSPSSSNGQDDFSVPCCNECSDALVELQKSQKRVEEARVEQNRKLDMIKSSLNVGSLLNLTTCLASRWIPVRALLIKIGGNGNTNEDENDENESSTGNAASPPSSNHAPASDGNESDIKETGLVAAVAPTANKKCKRKRSTRARKQTTRFIPGTFDTENKREARKGYGLSKAKQTKRRNGKGTGTTRKFTGPPPEGCGRTRSFEYVLKVMRLSRMMKSEPEELSSNTKAPA